MTSDQVVALARMMQMFATFIYAIGVFLNLGVFIIIGWTEIIPPVGSVAGFVATLAIVGCFRVWVADRISAFEKTAEKPAGKAEKKAAS